MRSLATVLILLASSVLAGCHDFSLGQSLPEDAVYDLKVEPLRVAPGGTLSITFRLRVGAEVAVTVNGLAATLDPSVKDGQRWTYQTVGDEGEILNVVVVASQGSRHAQVSAQAFLDTQPPAAPARDRVILEQNPPGKSDRLGGAAGCLTGSDVRSVDLALDASGRVLLASAPAAADGSFALQDLGDNAVARVYLFARDEAGNRSEATLVDNDIAGPHLVAADFSPRTPRAGLPLIATLRFDELPVGTPTFSLMTRATTVPFKVTALASGEFEAQVDALGLPPGPASLHVEAIDSLGNPGHDDQLVAVGSAEGFALDLVRLYHASSAGWSVMGAAGAAPFPARVEAGLVHGGVETLCGGTAVSSDGSFVAIAIGAALAGSDVVHLRAFDEAGGVVGEASLSPDQEPPTDIQVAVAPSIIGPAVPAVITVQSSEAIGPDSTVRVAGALAARDAGPWSKTAVWRYEMKGTETHGPATIVADISDLAGNKAPSPVTITVDIDLKAPVVAYQSAGPGWPPPSVPPFPTSYAPPTSVQVTVTEGPAPASGVDTVTWSAQNLRDGQWWNGSKFIPAAAPLEQSASASFSLTPATIIALDERVAFFTRATDKVGNVHVDRMALSNYPSYGWTLVYPSKGAALVPGIAVTGVRTPTYGLCVASYTCATAPPCGDPSLDGNIGLRYSPDGGTTWLARSPSPAIPVVDPVSHLAKSISMIAFDPTGTHGLVVGPGLVLALDGTCTPGLSAVTLPTTANIWSVAWDRDVAWVAAADGLYRSENFGLHWSSGGAGTAGLWNDLVVVGPGNILAVGASGAVVYTRDDGLTWTLDQISFPNDLYAVARTPDGTLWAGGEMTLVYSSAYPPFWQPVGYASLQPSWDVGFIRASAMGPYVRLREWNGTMGLVKSWRLFTGGTDFAVWHDSEPGEEWHEMTDVIPLDDWSAFGIGKARIPPDYTDYLEWTSFTVSRGL